MKDLKNSLAKLSDLKKEARSLVDTDFEKAKEKYGEIEDLQKKIDELKEKEELRNKLGGDDKPKNNEPENATKDGTVIDERGMFTGENASKPNEESDEMRDFKAYLNGEKRAIDGGNLKTDSGFVVVPEEVVLSVLKIKDTLFNLDQYVTVKNVVNGSGKYPVVRESEVEALQTVEELEPNPKLAVKPFFMLEYDIKTHRGYFRISQEAIQDSHIDVLAELRVWLARTIVATRNAAIVNVLKNGGPGEDGEQTQLQRIDATNIDDVKDAINLNVRPNYEHNVAIVSRTAFATLDKMKDSKGNYLLQPDIKEPTVKRLLGARVEILPDEKLGDAGKNTIVIGNLKDAIVLFDRSQYQADWTDYMHFGQCLMVALRQDVRLLDQKAAIVIDLDVTEEESPAA